MKKKILLLCFIGLGFGSYCRAQSSFDDFRSELLSSFNDFRSEILTDYKDFLDEIWGEYEQIKGEKRFSAPKPQMQPIASPVADDQPMPASLKDPLTKPRQTVSSEPDRASEDQFFQIVASVNTVSTMVDFFGIPVEINAPKFSIRRSLDDMKDYGAQWQELETQKVHKDVVAALHNKASELGLNGYLTFRLIKGFVDARFPQSEATARLAATHYLLLNCGYDARIALDGNGVPLVLLNSAETLYARICTNLDGNKYYVFADTEDYAGNEILRTCVLPKGANAGRKVDFRISKLNIPYRPHPYKIECGEISISGECNENLYAILYRYPQLPIDAYASSSPDPELRRQICDQVDAALSDMPRENAIECLLNFTQKGFEYATDQENHGFEKPYFFEEMVFYDKCDCEDRAIFYSFLLWNVLNVPCHMINYPEHESVAVKLDNKARGMRYRYDNGYFYISDPTYIGASTGMCMKQYIDRSPVIDYEYK